MSLEKKELKIFFRSDEIKTEYQSTGFMTEEAAGFDLILTKQTFLPLGAVSLLDFGVTVLPPEGYHTEILPRSSTAKKMGIIQANSIGLIDRDYCGENDVLMGAYIPHEGILGNLNLPVVLDSDKKVDVISVVKRGANISGVILPKGLRTSQLVLRKTNFFELKEFNPSSESRGGFGSTGQ